MSLYSCAGCLEFISATKARVQCQNCTHYDLCASCFVVGKTSHAHQISHDTMLFASSGHNFATVSKLKQPSTPVPNPLIRRRPLIAPPSLPPRPESTSIPYHPGPSPALTNLPPILQQHLNQVPVSQTQPQYQQVPPPAAYTPSPSYQTNNPPPITTQPNYQPSPAPVTTPHIPENPYANPPTSINPLAHPPAQPPITTPLLAENPYANPPQTAAGPGGHQTQNTAPASSTAQWQTLQASGVPSPFLRSLLSAVFERLDVHRTGSLSPEQYSAYLDVQQYQLEEDVCKWREVIRVKMTPTDWILIGKKSLLWRPGYNSEDLADFELRLTYENFGIDHRLQTRNIAPSQMPPLSGGKMPMITLEGFIELTFIELFSDATPLGLSRMNMILRHYGVWRELGDMPREVWPTTPPQELVDRVRRVSAAARNRGQELIDANKVKLQLQAQGRQNVIELWDPPGTRYHYQY
jgi:hypothetical protein